VVACSGANFYIYMCKFVFSALLICCALSQVMAANHDVQNLKAFGQKTIGDIASGLKKDSIPAGLQDNQQQKGKKKPDDKKPEVQEPEAKPEIKQVPKARRQLKPTVVKPVIKKPIKIIRPKIKKP